jgi:hypothetical protein
MKKILTLLIATGAFASLHAQTREENRRVILGDGNGTYGGRNDRDVVLGRGNNGQYPGTYGSDRQSNIDQINREYDNKIYSIRNNSQLSNEEKERTIRQLERDRQRRLAAINRNYNGRYDDDRNDRYDKRSNGKKKGWEIGRGNPHRDDRNNKNWKNNRKKNKKWDDD